MKQMMATPEKQSNPNRSRERDEACILGVFDEGSRLKEKTGSSIMSNVRMVRQLTKNGNIRVVTREIINYRSGNPIKIGMRAYILVI